VLAAAVFLVGCIDSARTTPTAREAQPDARIANCIVDLAFIRDGGVGRDGIPALTDPEFVSADPEPENRYLSDQDRVIGMMVGEPLAIPHNVLWWHEIVNLDLLGGQVAVTYCPLTGSGMVFERGSVRGDEFGVSGLLWKNNLIMYNRGSDESLWPQMFRGAACGEASGTTLRQSPALEMTWGGWKELYPTTKVVSSGSSQGHDWRFYPYGGYESFRDSTFWHQDAMPPLDPRRHPKERVLGIPSSSGGIAFPFDELEAAGDLAVAQVEVDGRQTVVFWNSDWQGAGAFDTQAPGGENLTFRAGTGAFQDLETGSQWRLDGRAVAGPLEGVRLRQVEDAFVSFWGAWAAFHPDTDLWEGGEG
jgi:hypothetical protein